MQNNFLIFNINYKWNHNKKIKSNFNTRTHKNMIKIGFLKTIAHRSLITIAHRSLFMIALRNKILGIKNNTYGQLLS